MVFSGPDASTWEVNTLDWTILGSLAAVAGLVLVMVGVRYARRTRKPGYRHRERRPDERLGVRIYEGYEGIQRRRAQ